VLHVDVLDAGPAQRGSEGIHDAGDDPS
jgi:hypothetical protein